MWGGKKQLKHFLAGLWAVSLFFLLGLPIFSAPGDEILTAEEYRILTESLETAKISLQAAKQEIELLKLTLIQQEKILTMQSNLWPQLKTYSDEQKNALKNKYFEGLLAGLLIGIPAGGAAGAWGGFSFGVRVNQ